jgi:hypothetical protein
MGSLRAGGYVAGETAGPLGTGGLYRAGSGRRLLGLGRLFVVCDEKSAHEREVSGVTVPGAAGWVGGIAADGAGPDGAIIGGQLARAEFR